MADEVMRKVKGEKLMYSLSEGGKNARILPTLRLTDEDLPELKDWKVGKKYDLSIQVELMSTRQGSEYSQENKDKRIHTTFKVVMVGVDNDTDDAAEPKSFEHKQASVMLGNKTGSRYDKRG